MNKQIEQHPHEHGTDRVCMSRRNFLLAGGIASAVVAVGGLPGLAHGMQAIQASYPREKIGQLSALKLGEPVMFSYPYPDVSNILVRLGERAGGGIGSKQDVVAFNQQCTHMGGPLHGTFKKDHNILGACPIHLSTFDLTRHGMVVSGHGTASLPQILLELEGDDIYAVGVMGLIYGYADNHAPRA